MKWISTIFVFFLTEQVFAQSDSLDLSLAQAIEWSLKNNYQIVISNKNIETAKINNSWANAGRYPTLTARLSNNNKYNNVSALSSGIGLSTARMEYTTATLYPALALQWNLFNGWAVDITKANYELLEQLSQGNTALLIENTVQTIILAYYQTLLQKEKVNLTKNVMQLSRDRYNYVLAKQELGTSVTFDVLQVKTTFLSDSVNYLMQESNYSNSLKNLNYLLGDTTHSIYRLTDSFEAIDEQYNYSDLRQKAFENNSTLKNQYLNQKILQNNIGLAKSSYYPTLSLSTGTDYIQSWNFAGGESADDYTYDFYVNLTLSYTLYGAGSKKRQMQKALISQDIGEVSIAEMQHKVENDLYRLYDLYLVRKQLLKVSIEAEQSAALNLELGNERFKNGTINSFNLRDLTIYYMNAANQRLESTYNLIQGHTELLRITGGIVNGN